MYDMRVWVFVCVCVCVCVRVCVCVYIFIQIYRSYIALGQYDVVQDEVKEDAQTALQDVKLLASVNRGVSNKDFVSLP
jgi:hypothetical protein